MARELEKQIKQQELSVRHWKLYGSGIGVYSIDGTSCGRCHANTELDASRYIAQRGRDTISAPSPTPSE
jgi:hypothetical protein